MAVLLKCLGRLHFPHPRIPWMLHTMQDTTGLADRPPLQTPHCHGIGSSQSCFHLCWQAWESHDVMCVSHWLRTPDYPARCQGYRPASGPWHELALRRPMLRPLLVFLVEEVMAQVPVEGFLHFNASTFGHSLAAGRMWAREPLSKPWAWIASTHPGSVAVSVNAMQWTKYSPTVGWAGESSPISKGSFTLQAHIPRVINCVWVSLKPSSDRRTSSGRWSIRNYYFIIQLSPQVHWHQWNEGQHSNNLIHCCWWQDNGPHFCPGDVHENSLQDGHERSSEAHPKDDLSGPMSELELSHLLCFQDCCRQPHQLGLFISGQEKGSRSTIDLTSLKGSSCSSYHPLSIVKGQAQFPAGLLECKVIVRRLALQNCGQSCLHPPNLVEGIQVNHAEFIPSRESGRLSHLTLKLDPAQFKHQMPYNGLGECHRTKPLHGNDCHGRVHLFSSGQAKYTAVHWLSKGHVGSGKGE